MWPWKEKIQPKTVIKNVLGEVLLEKASSCPSATALRRISAAATWMDV
jgi:hypothetical protein